MEGSDYLYTLAQVSVAFVGFSAIVAALRQRSGGLHEIEKLYMTWLIERSLAVLAFALLPALLTYLGMSGAFLWRVLSFALGIYVLVLAMRSIAAHMKRPLPIPRGTYWTRVAVGVVIACVQLMNAAGYAGPYSMGWYFFGIAVLLLGAGLVFVALLQVSDEISFREHGSVITKLEEHQPLRPRRDSGTGTGTDKQASKS